MPSRLKALPPPAIYEAAPCEEMRQMHARSPNQMHARRAQRRDTPNTGRSGVLPAASGLSHKQLVRQLRLE